MTLVVRDVRFTYPGWPATLRGASLEVAAGSSGFLLGPSGCGKSTLLRCIAGLETGYGGTVRWDGELLDPLPPNERRVGMLFQEPALFPHLSVAGNVAFGMRYRGVARSKEPVEAERFLELVGLAHRGASRVDQLSGGERQRVALARTLAARPRVILLDEPLSSLDEPLRVELGTRVKELLSAQGIAALWVTHDRDEARRLSDRLWELVDGQALEVGP